MRPQFQIKFHFSSLLNCQQEPLMTRSRFLKGQSQRKANDTYEMHVQRGLNESSLNVLTCPDPEDVLLSLCESSGQVLSGGGVSWAGDPVVGPVLGLLDDVARHFGAAVVFRNVPHQLDHVLVNVLEIKEESAVEREQCRCHKCG